jgi:membrane protease YdiL (CAAX protease family)
MIKIKFLFWNDSETRLRSGWRIFAYLDSHAAHLPDNEICYKSHLAYWLEQESEAGFLSNMLCPNRIPGNLEITNPYRQTASGFVGLSASKGVAQDIAAGFIISAILVLSVVLIEIANGWLSIEPVRLQRTEIAVRLFHILFVGGFVAAWWENLFFVGYLFLNLKDGCGFWCAFVLNCLIFGSIHLGNPNASIAAFGGIVLIHAYELFAFLRTGNLWLVLGIHAGWNFLQGLTGFPVSGQAGYEIIAQVNITPDWVGGGLFGPEAGLVVVLTSAMAFALIWFYTKLGRG